MRYALVVYPELRHAGLDAFRARHDPTAPVIREHVTIVFPLPEVVGRARLREHVLPVAARWSPFRLHLTGLEESWDHWLLLGAGEGAREMIRLHDELYTGVLAPYLRTDLPYAPHVGLGFFAGPGYDPFEPEALTFDEGSCRRAKAEAEAIGLDFWCTVDRLTLVEVDDQIRWTRDAEVIPLGPAGV